MLNTDNSDSDIIQYIEDVVPVDERHIFDNKREVYVSSSDASEQRKRRAELAETIASLANVPHRSDYRFIFVGFDDNTQFTGIEYLGDNGGEHLYDADDRELQNILRDHVEPSPSVEKHRLNCDEGNGLILVIERVASPPIVFTRTVNSDGDRITTEGIAPTRRGSETTHMSHSDFRQIVDDYIKNIFEKLAGDIPIGELSTIENEQPRTEEEEQDESSQEQSSGFNIGPSSGLDTEQKDIQNEIIRVAYNEFEDQPFRFMLSHRASHLISEVADRTSVDEETVQSIWKFSRDDEFFRKRGRSWRMTPKALFRAEELGLDIKLSDEIQEELLDVLLQSYRSDPHHHRIRQESLIEDMEYPRASTLQNLWFLEEKGYIEREAYLGGNADVEISDRGRRYME